MAAEWSGDMGLLDWIKQRKQMNEMKALASKYGHDAIGANGSAARHYQKLKGPEPGAEKPKTLPRPKPSWER